MLSVHEEPALKEMTSPDTEELDGFKSRLATPPKFWDVDTLLHIQQATVQHADLTHWHMYKHLTRAFVLLRTNTLESLVPVQPPTKEFKGVELSTTNLTLPNSYNVKQFQAPEKTPALNTMSRL